MKSKLLLSLLTFSLLPAQLCATIVRAEIWQRPNGTRVVIMGDYDGQCSAEKQQITDFIEHLKSRTNNPYILIHDDIDSSFRFLDEIEENDLDHETISLLDLDDFDLDDIGYFDYDGCNISPLFQFTQNFFAQAQNLQNTMPAALQDPYKNALVSLQALVRQMPEGACLPLGPNDCYRDCNSNLIDQKLITSFLNNTIPVFSYIIASRIEREAARESYIIIDEAMVNELASPLTTLGYTRLTNLGNTFSSQAYGAMIAEKLTPIVYAHGGYPYSCFSEGWNDLPNIMNETLNPLALKLNTLFQYEASLWARWFYSWLPTMKPNQKPVKPNQKPVSRPPHINTSDDSTHTTPAGNTPSMTPTEYRQWSAEYDRDMQNENMPISGFGSN